VPIAGARPKTAGGRGWVSLSLSRVIGNQHGQRGSDSRVVRSPHARALRRAGIGLRAVDDHLPGPRLHGLGRQELCPGPRSVGRRRSELGLHRVHPGLCAVRDPQRVAGRRVRAATRAVAHRALVVGLHRLDRADRTLDRRPRPGGLPGRIARGDASGHADRGAIPVRGGRGGRVSEHYTGIAQLVPLARARVRPGGRVDVRPAHGRIDAPGVDGPGRGDRPAACRAGRRGGRPAAAAAAGALARHVLALWGDRGPLVFALRALVPQPPGRETPGQPTRRSWN